MPDDTVRPAARPTDADDLIRNFNQTYFGGRPSGIGEALREIRQTERDNPGGIVRSATQVVDTFNQRVQEAIAAGIAAHNEVAEALGLPRPFNDQPAAESEDTMSFGWVDP